MLRYGALPVEFRQVALQQVSATLGKDSLHAGLIAGVVGLVLVAVYMLLYYRGLGLVVVLGLAVWAGLMYSIVCYLSANQGLALTLSGITGIIVSVGTTVDSYVVYFERLKDEVRSRQDRAQLHRAGVPARLPHHPHRRRVVVHRRRRCCGGSPSDRCAASRSSSACPSCST